MAITELTHATNIAAQFANGIAKKAVSLSRSTINVTSKVNTPVDSFDSSKSRQDQNITLSNQLRKLSFSNRNNSANFRPVTNSLQGNSSVGRFLPNERTQSAGDHGIPAGTANNQVTFGNQNGLQCRIDTKLLKKYPEFNGAIDAIMGLEGKACSGGGYNFSAAEVDSILGEVRNVLADPNFKIYAAGKAGNGEHSYAERVEGAIKVYNKTDELMANPEGLTDASRTDVLSHILLHELLHEAINRHRQGADCPGPDPELELQTATELKA